MAGRTVRAVVSPGSQPQGSEGDSSGDPGLVPPDPERQGVGRLGPDVQPVHPWLDQLLQSLLQVRTLSDPSSDRCFSGPVGTPQVQASAATTEGRAGLAGTGDPDIAGSLCSLAASVWSRAEHWEPYELRGSRTVLGARGGEIPPRDSLAAVSAEHDSGTRHRLGNQPSDAGRLGPAKSASC